MNRQQFFQWMNDPASLNSESVTDLQQLAFDYPYFQTGRLLHLMNLKLLRDYRFEQELRQVAAFVADRTRLKEWIGILEEFEITGSKLNAKNDLLDQTTGHIPVDDHLKNIEEQIRVSLNEIELRKSRLNELIEEKRAIVGDAGFLSEEPADSKKGFSMRPLPKDEMLEEFIRQQQKQVKGRSAFYNPEESAKRSIEENEGILSETLARLIAAQGKKEKAIKIYQQLMVNNPQKSSYFAAQIEKLRKES